MVAEYPDIVVNLLKTFEPNNVMNYAFKLAHAVSTAVQELRVIGVDEDLAEARLFMYWSARITLGNAMRLVGLTPLERM